MTDAAADLHRQTSTSNPPTNENRRTKIIRLLQTRDQHLPQPRRRTETIAGFVHRTLAPAVCETCDGVDSFGCSGCGGRGWVERLRARDPYAVEKVLPYGFTVSRHEAAAARDGQLGRLADQLRPARSAADLLAEANARPEAWELARRRMYRRFDYGALDLALEQLRCRHEPAYHVLHQVFVYAWVVEPVGAMLAVAEAGLVFLDARLPDPLRAPGDDPVVSVVAPLERSAGQRLYVERDDRIRRRLFVGRESTFVVALSEGLSVRQVNRIASKGEAA